MLDVRTAEGCKTFVEGLDDVLRDIFYNKHTLPPIAYVFATHDPVTSTDLQKPTALPLCILNADGTELTKDEFSQVIKTVAHASKACGVVFASESYVVTAPPPEDEAKLIELAEQGRLGEYDKRTEGIVMIVEHQALGGTWIRNAPITRRDDPEDEFAMLGRFETILDPKTGDGPVSEKGRFTHFL